MGSITKTPDTHALLARILGVLGVASLASCAARNGGDGAGDDAGSSSGASSASESESESSSGSMSSSSETDTDDEPILDVHDSGPDSGDGDGDGDETEGGVDCSGFHVGEDEAFVPPIQCLPPENGWNNYWESICFQPPEGVACETEPVPHACIIDAYECGLAQSGEEIGCGPFTTDTGDCCYVVWGGCPVGRPWIVDGRARRAELEDGAKWSSVIELELATLDADTRAALADAWASEGLGEHASIAAFTRFTIQLLALGAPSALIQASLRARGDEVRHARACFALAGAYAGFAIGPGPLDIRGGLDEVADLDSIAQTLAAEGCIAETVSLLLLAAARDRARNPAVRAMLAAIVEEEEAHVLLAWEALAWMCRRGTKIAGVMAVFREAERHVGFGATTERHGDGVAMREHGYLAIEVRREIAADALARVVAPAARELFASLGTPVFSDGDGGQGHRAQVER
jgi:hypothetical protein